MIPGEFLSDLSNFFFTRREKIPYDSFLEYRKAKDDIAVQEKIIQAKLPPDPESQEKMRNLIDFYSDEEAAAVELSYQCGFFDGARLILQMLAGM